MKLPDGYLVDVYVHPRVGAKAKLPVVYLHGIQSHPGWFGGSAWHMASCGHEVWQVTRRGSGLNVADRGHANSARQLIEDVEAVCLVASDHHGGSPVHLVGVSWGGKLAACYAADVKRVSELASLTLIAPGIVPKVGVGPVVKIAIGISLLCCPRHSFAIPLNDVRLFTENERMQEYLRSDHCRLRRATARFLLASEVLGRQLAGQTAQIDVPTTLILADQDRIIDNARTEKLVRTIFAGRITVVTLAGSHTLEFETDPSPLYDCLCSALEEFERG